VLLLGIRHQHKELRQVSQQVSQYVSNTDVRDRITKRYIDLQKLELVGLEFFLMIIAKDDYIFDFCTTVVF
jgi:hypothetical protein